MDQDRRLDEVLAGVTALAGEVPFMVLGMDGQLTHVSDGVRDLGGGTLEVEGRPFVLEGGGLRGDISFLSSRVWGGASVMYTSERGQRRAFRVYSRPVPLAQPLLVLLRLDPVPLSFADEQGFLIRRPEEYPDMVEFFGLLTRSEKMKDLFSIVGRAAQTDVTVLVRGESGTGKEGVARAVHMLSKRKEAPFVAVNCAALSPTLLESELFGHVKGAFTGAIRDRGGLFAQADGGTIFLDEVAELSLDLQAKLLRVLQERSYTPVGSSHVRNVDVRVISATHRSLRHAVEVGAFREDLMFRLRVLPLWIPALRERREDIELLVSAFLHRLADLGRHRFRRIDPLAMQKLLDHRWLGNVRELENVLEYATVVGTGDKLTLACLPPEFREVRQEEVWGEEKARVVEKAESAQGDSTARSWPALERERMLQALAEARGKRGKAAELLGMHRTTFWRKMKQYGLDG